MLIQQTTLSIALLHRRHYYLASVWWTTKNDHLGPINSEYTSILWVEDQTGYYKTPEIAFSPLEIIIQCWSSLPPIRYHLWYGPKTLIWRKGKLMLKFPTMQIFYKVNVQSQRLSKRLPPRKGQKISKSICNHHQIMKSTNFKNQIQRGVKSVRLQSLMLCLLETKDIQRFFHCISTPKNLLDKVAYFTAIQQRPERERKYFAWNKSTYFTENQDF